MTTSHSPVEESIYHITLMRHAESTGNAEHRVQGQMEFPLSEKGRAQAAALAKRWLAEGVHFDRVIVSPQERAHHTGQIIAEALNAPLEADPLWIERNNGIMAGRREEELRTMYKENDFMSPYHPIGQTGEGDWPLYLRAGQALYHLLKRPPGRYLVVSHGGTLNAVLYAILGIAPQANYQGPRFRFENTAFAKFRYYPLKHRWRIDVIGDRAHWNDE